MDIARGQITCGLEIGVVPIRTPQRMQAHEEHDPIADLVASHPLLFKGREPPNSDLPPGWFSLTDRLCTDIEHELGANLVAEVSVQQIKEKWGMLRFYAQLGAQRRIHVDIAGGRSLQTFVLETDAVPSVQRTPGGHRDRLFELIDAACEASGSVCQICGAPGSLRALGWRQTLCDEHFRIANGKSA